MRPISSPCSPASQLTILIVQAPNAAEKQEHTMCKDASREAVFRGGMQLRLRLVLVASKLHHGQNNAQWLPRGDQRSNDDYEYLHSTTTLR